jgi:uncharacterized membrane protein YeaQ/YmgE (transglycosylase-associated protein family)
MPLQKPAALAAAEIDFKLKIHATSDALYWIQPQSRGDLMDIIAVIVTLAIGAIAGWLAGVLVEGAGFGLLINVLLGIAGAFIAALLFPRLGLGLTLGGGIVGAIVTSALGAVVLLLIVNLVQRLFS